MRVLIACVMIALAGCAGTFKPPTEGPTVNLRVEPDIKAGIPLISTAGLTLTMYQVNPEAAPDTNRYESLGWKDIPMDGSDLQLLLPADKALAFTMTYRSSQLFGPNLSGSQSYMLMPEKGASYVMKFWTDKKHFSVKVFREDAVGNLVQARVTPLD